MDRWLLRAAAVFVVAVLVHNCDHLRRGTDILSADLFWLGVAGVVLEVLVVVLICQRSAYAPLAAVVGGVVLASGYIEAHFLPAHAWFSDSFVSGAPHVNALSWFAASFEIAAAALLAVVGFVAFGRRGGLEALERHDGTESTLGAALTHPLALTFAVCQAVIVVISFAQR